MAHRIKERQAIHDKKVQEMARRLRRARYFVRADLPSHPRPPRIGGIRPDIYAHKKGKRVIYEVETRESFKKDSDQRKKLAKAAAKKDIAFRILIAK